jgi:hypothetical protein
MRTSSCLVIPSEAAGSAVRYAGVLVRGVAEVHPPDAIDIASTHPAQSLALCAAYLRAIKRPKSVFDSWS